MGKAQHGAKNCGPFRARTTRSLCTPHDDSYLPKAREGRKSGAAARIHPSSMMDGADGEIWHSRHRHSGKEMIHLLSELSEIFICSRLSSVRFRPRTAEPAHFCSLLWRPTMATTLLRTFAHRPTVAAGALFGGRSSATSVVRAAAPSSLASLSAACTCTSTSATRTAANAVAARYMSTDGHKHRNIGISAHIDR